MAQALVEVGGLGGGGAAASRRVDAGADSESDGGEDLQDISYTMLL